MRPVAQRAARPYGAALALTGVTLLVAGCPSVVMQGSGGTAALVAAGRDPGFTSLRAVASVEQITGSTRIRGRVYVMLRRPSTIRIDAMSPADTPLSILVADETRFALMDVGGNAYYTGPPSSCNVARLLSIPMPPEAVVDILTGTPPLIEATQRRVEYMPKGYHLLTLEAPSGGLKQTIQLVSGAMGTAALRSVVWRADTLLYDLRFRDIGPVDGDGPALPRRIQFFMPSEGTTVTLSYAKVEIDPDLPDEAFVIEPPAGLPVSHLSCDEPD